MIDSILGGFAWYRRLRGGRWGRYGGLLWGHNWMKLRDECVEKENENWGRK